MPEPMLEMMMGAPAGTLDPLDLFFATIVSLLLGLGVAGIYRFRTEYSQSLSMTLVLLPAMVQIIIMLVGSNIGAGVAVAGAFSLIRFRSVPGNARDIAHLFFVMSLGFVTGMGYLLFAVLFFVLVGTASMLLTAFRFGQGEQELRTLRIRIPESLDYEGLFDDIFAKYTHSVELQSVKTTQMGSLFDLKYIVRLNIDDTKTKAFIDEIRIRNGNLNVILSRPKQSREEL